MLSKTENQEWEGMVDHMRADLDSGMQLTKIEMVARKIVKEDGRDFDEEFKKWKIKMKVTPHIMKVECAWCGLDMGNKLCNEDQQDKISHGMCNSCKTKMEKEISDYKEVR